MRRPGRTYLLKDYRLFAFTGRLVSCNKMNRASGSVRLNLIGKIGGEDRQLNSL